MDDLRAAVRSLLSTPGPTLVVIATLAIAVGANTAVFSIVSGVLLRPLGYGDDGGLVVPWTTTGPQGRDRFRLSPADYRDLRDDADSFAGQVALYRFIGSTLTGGDEPARVGTMAVTPRLFRVLQTTPAAGSLFGAEDEKPGGPREVVLTYASWTRRFGGDPALVGSTIELDDAPYTVVGVTEPGFRFPPGDDEVEMFFPMRLNDAILLDRDHRMFDGIARLANGVSIDEARSEMTAIADRLAREYPDTNAGWGLTAQSLREELLGELGPTLWVLSGAVLLVLLLACASIANVLVARGTVAGREFAVRAALGARARELCRRSLAESLLLGLVGGTAGVLLALWGIGLLRTLLPADIPRARAIGLDGTVLAFAVAASIGATVLFGSLPALRAMTPDLATLLKPAGASGTAGRGDRRLREAMVVVEVALAVVLLVGAGLMVRSFARLSRVDPGFRDRGVVSVAVQLPSSRYSRAELRPFFERLLERVERLPGVRGAGAVSDLPMSSVGLGFELEFTVPGLDAVSPTARPNADVRLIFPGYFDAMGMEVVRGRAFDSLDATRPVAIVNETLAARYFPEVEPVGRTLVADALGELEVVGVVSDVHHDGLQSKYESEIYVPYGRIATAEMDVVVRSDLDTAAVAGAVGDTLTQLDPELAPSRVSAVSDLLWESIARPRFNTALLASLALCAALLAIVGTYGIVTYAVSRRTGEIGVRMALGADAASTVGMIVREALRVVLVGVGLGTIGALGATRFLGRLLFDTRPTDPVTYGVVLCAAVLVGLVAAWLPARRATRVDPVAALRDE